VRNGFRAAGPPSYGNDMPGSRPLLRTTLGDVLRRIRLDQGRTLADVASAGRISMQYLSELERGRKEASSEILAAICDALEVDLPDVLAEVGRDLASSRAATEQQALRLGLYERAPGFRAGDIVGLLAA
jgi:transcriptional regulator with XRE-family HTH domain